jgi:hypothetical protein
VKTRAAQHVAPLKEAVTWLKDTRELMDMIVSWCQSLQRTTAADEYSETFANQNTVPAKLFSAPVGQALIRNNS